MQNRIRYIIYFISVISICSCQLESFYQKEYTSEKKSYNKTRHFLFYFGNGQQDLNYPQPIEKYYTNGKTLNDDDLKNLNLTNIPKNFSGQVIVVSEEDNFVANMQTDIEYSKNDSIVFRGNISDQTKSNFESIEIQISDLLLNEISYNIANNSIYINSPIEILSIDDKISFDIPNQDSTILSTSLDKFRVSEIIEFEKNQIVEMYSGKIKINGKTLTFYSISDPLPLIPIIVGAAAIQGVSYLKKAYYDPWVKDKRNKKIISKVRKEKKKEKE